MKIELSWSKKDSVCKEEVSHQEIYNLWYILGYANDRLSKESVESEMRDDCERLLFNVGKLLDKMED